MRIEPTHIIDVWVWQGKVKQTPCYQTNYEQYYTDDTTIALFLIREKTPFEKSAWSERLRELTNQ